MTSVNGALQAQFMPESAALSVIPVDVKSIAMALVADPYGEFIVTPIESALTGAGLVSAMIAVDN